MPSEKRSFFTVGRTLLCACALILPLASCNFFGIPDYTLTVAIEPGVTGTPAAGVHSFPDLAEVEYKYTPVNSLHTVEVLIEGDQESAEDSLTIYSNTSLVARLVDIRGDWTVTSRDASSNSITFKLAFSGPDVLGGAFADSRGYAGTWTGKSNAIVITYGNWEAYVYSGTLFSMSGTYKNGSAAGTWSAKRAE